MGEAEPKWDENNIGILAYGSLLWDPGKEIQDYTIGRIVQPTPWPIEYARASGKRGCGPTLVRHERGAPVTGAVFVLNLKNVQREAAREMLRQREGKPKRDQIREMPLAGLRCVIFADLEPNIPDDHLTAEYLAELAIASVPLAGDENGVRYLANNVAHGIRTPLTEAYGAAILRKTGAPDLAQAERVAARPGRALQP